MVLTYTGPENAARAVLEPLLDLGHAGGTISQLPYPELQRLLDDPPGYRNAVDLGNARTDVRTRFLVTMMCKPGEPMLTPVDEEEPRQRARLRAPRPTG